MPLIQVAVIRDEELVTSAETAVAAVSALLGDVGGHPRRVEYDGDAVWNVEATEDECALLRIRGYLLVRGDVGGAVCEICADMP